MIDIVDVGTGNIASLESALKKLNIRYKLCSRVSDFKNKKIIIPGVGAFNDFIKKLRIKKIDKYIIDSSIQNTPILGICLGFQVLFSSSTEHQKTHGLNILQVDFNKIKSIKVVPHVGWNSC
jgi:glutamine amidotransferase